MRAKLSSKNQITVPAQIRKRLDVHAHESIEFVEDGDTILVRRAKPPLSLLELKGIVPALDRPTSSDFGREIREAMDDRADEIVRRMRSE